MAHPYLSYSALALSIIPGIFGSGGIFMPEATLKHVQFPVPADPAARKLTFALLQMHGVRNLAVTSLQVLVWSTGNQRLMGLAMMASVGMTICDGLVSRSLIGGGEWNHWGFTPVLAGVAAGLLGWFS